ncbi:NUDIX domain-containing protein [Shewanella oncorhynchi]|uniref:NUDIX domain-containing protein n=1 Tax=Shewanella oncorhynchi TaxID=2726434 RepID=UPI003D7A415E
MNRKTKELKVVLGLTLSSNKVLLTKRDEKSLPDIHNMWEVPGGKVEKDEDHFKTAEREVYEETGYQVRAIKEFPEPYIVTRGLLDLDLVVYVYCVYCELKFDYKFEVNDKKISQIKWFDIESLEYLDVIAGSREFIYQAATELLNIKSTNHDSECEGVNFSCNIILEHIDIKKNSAKFYALIINFHPEESKAYSVQFRYGKIKSYYSNLKDLYKQNPETSNFQIKQYCNDLEMVKPFLSQLNSKIKKGYYVTQYSDNFPFKSWIEEHKEDIKDSKVYLKPKLKQQRLDF